MPEYESVYVMTVTYSVFNGGVFVIMKKYDVKKAVLIAALTVLGGQAFAADQQLAPVIVEAERDGLGSLVQETQNVGMLGAKNVMDTPFAVMNLSHKNFEYFASPGTGVTDVLSLNPSVRANASNVYSDIAIRGFRLTGHGMYVNGIPGLLDQQHLTDVFVESATVISGPNLGVVGTPVSQAVGGTVDFQSKRVQDKPNRGIILNYQGGASFRTVVDVGQRYGENNRYGLRVMADYTDGETTITNEVLREKNIFVNWDQKTTNSKTNLLIGYNYAKHTGGTHSFSFGNNVTYMPKAPDASRNFKPDWSYNEYDNWIMALNHDQKLSEHVTAFVNAGTHRENWFGYIDGTPTITNNSGDYYVGLTNYPLVVNRHYLGTGIKGKFQWGKTEHDYVINIDKNWLNNSSSKDPNFGTGGTYTVYGNLYSGNNSWPSPVLPSSKAAKSYDMQMVGWHIADTISMDNGNLEILAGLHGQRGTQTKPNSEGMTYSGINPTFGITYKLTKDFSIYASHTENFFIGSSVPTGGKNYANAGELLDPIKTKQDEFGLKYKAEKLLHTLSFYTIKQPNYNDVTSNGNLYYLENGEQRNKGIEYTVSGEINKKFDFIGGINYITATQALTGIAVNGVAKWSATAGIVYKHTKDLSWILRTQYMSTAPINNGKLTVPSHFIIDVGASWETHLNKTPVTVKAMVYNLTNKDYWVASASNNSVLLGRPRTFVLSAGFHL